MPIYTALLIYAVARGIVASGLVIFAPADRRPWHAVIQAAADVCCALLLRACFDAPYRASMGKLMIPLFLFAAIWSARVWLLIMQSMMTGGDDAPGEMSALGALGLGFGSGFRALYNAIWHTCFVAPSIVCAAFMLVGLTEELPPR